MFPNFRCSRWILLACGLIVWTTGCFSFGGKTTYVDESSETKARVAGLESRVGALEQTLSSMMSPAAGPRMYPSSAPVDGAGPQPMR